MTSHGHTPAQLHRAIAAGNLLAARALAAELTRPLGLGEALGLLLLMCEREPRTFPRAGARFIGRLALERPLLVADVEHAAATLLHLPPVRRSRRHVRALRHPAADARTRYAVVDSREA
jgi:hypothetical protein